MLHELHEVNDRPALADPVVVPNVFACVDLERRCALLSKRREIPVINSANLRGFKPKFREKLRERDGFRLFGVHVVKMKEEATVFKDEARSIGGCFKDVTGQKDRLR